MKPAHFDYVRPASAEEAVAQLGEYGEDARVLAGGQSLIPLLNRRLIKPKVLVDVGRLHEYRYLHGDGAGLRVGALTPHVWLERTLDRTVLDRFPVLPETAHLIGHLPVRTRGTVGGTLAHADPRSEWCLLAVLLGAEITAHGPHGRRVIKARDFFLGRHLSALLPGELLTEVRLPRAAPSAMLAEHALQPGRLPEVAVAAAVEVGADGLVSSARIALGGVTDRPVRAYAAERALLGRDPEQDGLVADIARLAAEPGGDYTLTADHRALATALATRVLDSSVGCALWHADQRAMADARAAERLPAGPLLATAELTAR
ncbi:FAD binding domain-containing protein [Streptomyces sp. NPDC006879]|uniref:FAD binding domain-containing protein n=1 Tax=Streptomyces sp. NPDC006879 TaxID=3364767 RepID=UPI0036AE17DD